MSKTMTITATMAVWMNDYHTPAELLQHIERGDNVAAVGILSLYGPPDRKTFCDYTRMGEADVTLRLLPRDEQTKLAVQKLNQKLEDLRSRYMEAQSQILAQISKLQAIEYVSEA
jgi:hypothetical protein